jgi:hypothetical protein
VSLPPTADLVEVALLLLWAFLIGAAAGAGLRLALSRHGRRPAEPVTIGEPAAVLPAAPLVAAPVIGPLRPIPVPAAPETVPAPDFAFIFEAAPAPPAETIDFPEPGAEEAIAASRNAIRAAGAAAVALLDAEASGVREIQPPRDAAE